MKDAKGHGSDARGGSMGRSEFASQPHQGAKFQARQAMKAANSPDSWEARYGTQMDRDRLRAEAINQGVDVGFKSSMKEAGLSGGGQPVASNAHAAATLASGAKSAPVDTHPAMVDHALDHNEHNYPPADSGPTYTVPPARSTRTMGATQFSDREGSGPTRPAVGKWEYEHIIKGRPIR